MPDRTLIVPGTQATTLRDHTGATVYNAVRVSIGLSRKNLGGHPPEQWRALLGVEHAKGSWAPTRTSLLRGVSISAGEVVRAPYDRLPRPHSFFPYDWRLDCRYNAQRLIDHLRAEKSSKHRWNLIGHSQGGLIIVLASMLTRDLEEFGRLVARVVLVGCPLAGTQRALEAITVGRADFGDDADRVIAAREMAQTWPALYQMLPAWASVLGTDGRPLPSDRQFLEPGGYPGPWSRGIDPDLLRRARETHQLFAGPFSRFGPEVRTLVIQGEKQATPTYLVRTGARLATAAEKVGDRRALDFVTTKGDTLVPSEVTVKWGGRTLRDRTIRIAGKVKEHAMLCDGKFVAGKIADFLKATSVATLVLFGGLCFVSAAFGRAPAQAQQYRLQTAVTGTFSHAHGLVGVDLARDLGAGACAPGGPICEAPAWTALLGLYGGVVTGGFPLGATTHLGVERKLTPGLAFAIVGFVVANPAQGGLAARLDVQDVVALKVGRGWGEGPGLILSVEIALELLRDLGR